MQVSIHFRYRSNRLRGDKFQPTLPVSATTCGGGSRGRARSLGFSRSLAQALALSPFTLLRSLHRWLVSAPSLLLSLPLSLPPFFCCSRSLLCVRTEKREDGGGGRRAGGAVEESAPGTPSAYARAVRCPALTERAVAPGGKEICVAPSRQLAHRQGSIPLSFHALATRCLAVT